MKIIQLITRLVLGGAQRLAIETAADLLAAGHDAEIWCGPETGPEGNLFEEAARRAIPVRHFEHLRRDVSGFHDLRALVDLRRALGRARPAWLHTHSSKAGILGREAAAYVPEIRVAHTVHGFGFTSETAWPVRQVFVFAERRAARRTDRLFFLHEADRALARTEGIEPRGRAFVLPQGIDLVPFRDERVLESSRDALRGELHFGPTDLVIGFLGRLVPQKDPMTLIEAFDLLLRKSTERKVPSTPVPWLLLVGDGPLAPDIERRLSQAPALGARILRVGLQPDPWRWLAAMDVFVLPSRWEGKPLVLMEAMASGLAVVASDLPGVQELVRDGIDGLLVPAGSNHALAETIGRLRSRETRLRLGDEARKRALVEFGQDSWLHALRAHYSG